MRHASIEINKKKTPHTTDITLIKTREFFWWRLHGNNVFYALETPTIFVFFWFWFLFSCVFRVHCFELSFNLLSHLLSIGCLFYRAKIVLIAMKRRFRSFWNSRLFSHSIARQRWLRFWSNCRVSYSFYPPSELHHQCPIT